MKGQALLFTSARVVSDAGGYTSFEQENLPTVAKTFEVLCLVKVHVVFRLTRSEFTPRRDEHDPVAAVGIMQWHVRPQEGAPCGLLSVVYTTIN